MRLAVVIGRKVVIRFGEDQGLSWAAAVGFYLFLSIPPLMVAATWAGGLVVSQQTSSGFVVDQVSRFLPAERQLLTAVIHGGTGSAAYTAVTLLILAFSASRVFAALISAINVMWRRVDQLSFARRQLLRATLMAAAAGLLVASVGLEAGAGAIARAFGGSRSIDWLLRSQLVPVALLFAGLVATYKLVPRTSVRIGSSAIGAAAATLGIRAAHLVFATYLQAFGGFNTAYGALASVAVLLTWSLIVSIIVLLGAELVAVLDRRRIPNRGQWTG